MYDVVPNEDADSWSLCLDNANLLRYRSLIERALKARLYIWETNMNRAVSVERVLGKPSLLIHDFEVRIFMDQKYT
ncbi:hypothetical protein C5167_051193 [Papaver somniferum]|uniref:Uncharacterized protein n=1 Tax=Papaver somniferum TaxID=3469 RepID=A0A4Y7KTI1_PAPSO|nr:hypothetical protein C5167_051193 [Papaver somniferum]